MKKFRNIYFVVLTALAAVCMLTLSGCCVLADERADVVFVNCSDTPVGLGGPDLRNICRDHSERR